MTDDESEHVSLRLSPKWCLGEYRRPIRLGYKTGFNVDPRNEPMPGAHDSIRHPSLYSDALGEVPGLVDIAAAQNGDMVGQ
jgi:hypothetical protein